MAAGYCKLLVPLLLVLPAWLAGLTPSAASGTVEEDEKACSDQLASLASCIPFVSGTAQRPTPECCQDTQRVRSKRPECLCVLIKESADPAMGLPINTTLALQMPTACNIDARVSDCPRILKLPPGSPDAKIFTDAGGGQASTTANPSSPPSASSSASSGSSPATATATPRSTNGEGRLLRSVSWWFVGLLVSTAWAVVN